MNIARRLSRVLMACALFYCSATAAAVETYTLETIAEGLDHPWCIAFLANGEMLVTERVGRLRLIDGDGLRAAPVVGVPATYVRSQGGLFDVLPDPDYATNGLIYLSYAHGDAKHNTLRVARARLHDGRLHDLKVIFEVTPAKDTPVHYGGRMAFLPDGTLAITTGDGFDYREQAQNLDSLLGKVVRIHPDGSIPRDNPFVGVAGARDEIWTYGHRNPQGIAMDRDSGVLYMHEHGPAGGDEVNVLQPGDNYGWPAVTYGMDYSGAYVSPYQTLPGMREPLLHWTPSIAPAGLAVYSGAAFAGWRGNLLVTALVERTLRRVVVRDGNVHKQEKLLGELDERLRDVRVDAAGLIYVLTDSDKGRVLRLSPPR